MADYLGMSRPNASAPVAVIPMLDGAHLSHVSTKGVSEALSWFSDRVPIHVDAATALKEVRLSPMRAAIMKEIRDLNVDEGDIHIMAIRDFLSSETSTSVGLPDVVTAMEFNAMTGSRIVSVPAIFKKDSVPSGKIRTRFLVAGKWWDVPMIGISERLSVTLPAPRGTAGYTKAIAKLVNTADQYESEITVRRADGTGHVMSAKSMLGVLSLAIAPGELITIDAEGPDAKKAITVLTRRINALGRKSKKA